MVSVNRPDTLLSLLPFWTADGCEWLVALSAYFDESEGQDGYEPITVAGYVFTPGGYRRFAREWRKFLKAAKPGGLTHLHMTDLYAGYGEYRGLGDKREPIFARAVELINEHITAGIGVLFEKDEFEAAAPPWFAELQGSIYSTACQMCMRTTAWWLGEHGSHQLVSYAFETGHKFQHETNAVLRKLALAPRIEETHRYLTHAFVDKKQAAGLQAADVLAWSLAHTSAGFPDNGTIRLLRPHLLNLVRDRDRYHTPIFTGDKLRRFFEEQVNKPDGYYFKRPPEFRKRLR